MKKLVIALMAVVAVVLLLGETESLTALVLTKVGGLALLAGVCELWKIWKLDDDRQIRRWLED